MILASSSETLWAEHGLTGLVLFALFLTVGVFIRVNVKKDDKYLSFMDRNLTAERKERKAQRQERKDIAETNTKNTARLAEALDQLTQNLKNK